VIADGKGSQGGELVPYDDQNFAVAAQSVLNASEFVNGNGFYFYTTGELEGPSECGTQNNPSGLPAIQAPTPPNNTSEGTEHSANNSINDDLGFSLDDIDAPVKVVILSLWFWWKEIVVIAFTSAVILNIFMGQRNQRVELWCQCDPFSALPLSLQCTLHQVTKSVAHTDKIQGQA